MDAASTASTLAPSRSTTQLRSPCLPHSHHSVSRPRLLLPSASKLTTTTHWRSGVLRWSGRTTRRNLQSVDIAPSIHYVLLGKMWRSVCDAVYCSSLVQIERHISCSL